MGRFLSERKDDLRSFLAKPRLWCSLHFVAFLCFISAFAFVTSVFAQIRASAGEAGRPIIYNYKHRDFGAEAQAWDVVQDERGIMYFANNAGVLEYDGRTWRLIELPSRVSVRSLAVDAIGTGRIYVGAIGDFGYLGPDSVGELQFFSLLPPEARQNPDFDDVFTPAVTPGGVYFQGRSTSCRWSDEQLHCQASKSDFGRIFAAAGGAYVQQTGIGLMQMVDGSFRLVPGGERFAGEEITVVLSYPSTEDERVLLVGTRDFRLFLQNGRSFRPFATTARDRPPEDQLLAGAMLPDGSLALGTRLRGVLIVDRGGNILERIDRSTGLQDVHVHAVWPDLQGGLWAALQTGISRIEVVSPYSIFDADSGLEQEWREVIRHEGTLYVRGYTGLFAASLPAAENTPPPARHSQSLRFSKVPEIEPPVWSFLAAGNRLLVSSRNGIYEMSGTQARRIITYPSTPRTLYSSRSDPRRVYVGLVDGIASFRLTANSWHDEGKLEGIEETITSIAEGRNGRLWLVSQRRRVLRVDFTGFPGQSAQEPREREPYVRAYPFDEEAMTGRISVSEVASRPVFLTETGIFEFDDSLRRFVPVSSFAELARSGRRSFSGIAEDAHGNIWVASRKPGAVDFLLRRPDGNYVIDNTGLRQMLVWSIYPEPHSRVVWFGAPDYLLRYDPSVETRSADIFATLIRKVVVGEDTVVYGGAPTPAAPDSRSSLDADNASHAFPYRSDSLEIQFAAARFWDAERNEFQSYLEGFDSHWSDWSTRSSRSYTNLPEGRYRFRVRTRDVHGVAGHEATFAFSILPPWYRSGWAYALYVFIFCGFVLALWRFQLQRAQLRFQREMEHRDLEKLREMDRLKSRFFADISHEFRTPLTLILGPVGQMLNEATTPESQRRLHLVRRNAQYLLRLISQLLDISKLESGKMRLHAAPGDLVHHLKVIVMPFAAIGEYQGVSFTFEAPDQLDAQDGAEVYFDHEVLEKIVHNVLGNAFKFTPPGGTVAVKVRSARSALAAKFSGDTGQEGKYVEIAVSDTGIGIPREHLRQIFDRFYQVAGPRSREGIGIGLALVKDLVELHHGEVSIESEEGKGTTFVIRWPKGKDHLRPDEVVGETASQPADIHRPDQATAHYECHLEPACINEHSEHSEDETTVLVIDDHVEVRSFVREQLAAHYRILQARNGSEGLQKAVSFVPDLVLSDVMMQGMDGYGLCRALKGNRVTCHIPVILLTARAGQEDKLTGLGCGADSYLIKPFDPSELVVQVRNLIEQRRMLRERFSGSVVLKPSEMTVTPMDKAFLDRVLTAVQNNMGDPDFDVERLGREVGLSRSQLHRKLRALTNQPPTLLIRSIRLQRSAELLRQRAGSVAEIAYQVGFNSQAYFGKCFREQFGCSPKEYVAKCQGSPALLGPGREVANGVGPNDRPVREAEDALSGDLVLPGRTLSSRATSRH